MGRIYDLGLKVNCSVSVFATDAEDAVEQAVTQVESGLVDLGFDNPDATVESIEADD
jgi:hypothetical protein